MKCEIEFLPVGSGSKPGDAIVVRYGTPEAFELMIVDGGTLQTGDALVSHIQTYFPGRSVSHVVLTHPDGDHASGLRTVLEKLRVGNLWLHVPWIHAAASRPYFANKNWTDGGLSAAIKQEYDIVSAICDTAINRKVSIFEPFAGSAIGPFKVLSPYPWMYELLLPQFDRTPEADQGAIEAQRWWLGKQERLGLFSGLLEKAVAKAQQWVPETWSSERLRDGGVTSATNESSVVLYGSFDEGPVLLTGDAGVSALWVAAYEAGQQGLPLGQFDFVQIPHHGSRRNVGPTVLNQLVGPIQPQGSGPRFTAFVSAPPDDDTHPRKMVLNAFLRRGGKVIATQGTKKIYYGGFPTRPDYLPAATLGFASQVEEYD